MEHDALRRDAVEELPPWCARSATNAPHVLAVSAAALVSQIFVEAHLRGGPCLSDPRPRPVAGCAALVGDDCFAIDDTSRGVAEGGIQFVGDAGDRCARSRGDSASSCRRCQPYVRLGGATAVRGRRRRPR